MRGSAKPGGTELESSPLSSDALCLLHITSKEVMCIRGVGGGETPHLQVIGIFSRCYERNNFPNYYLYTTYYVPINLLGVYIH